MVVVVVVQKTSYLQCLQRSTNRKHFLPGVDKTASSEKNDKNNKKFYQYIMYVYDIYIM